MLDEVKSKKAFLIESGAQSSNLIDADSLVLTAREIRTTEKGGKLMNENSNRFCCPDEYKDKLFLTPQDIMKFFVFFNSFWNWYNIGAEY